MVKTTAAKKTTTPKKSTAAGSASRKRAAKSPTKSAGMATTITVDGRVSRSAPRYIVLVSSTPIFAATPNMNRVNAMFEPGWWFTSIAVNPARTHLTVLAEYAATPFAPRGVLAKKVDTLDLEVTVSQGSPPYPTYPCSAPVDP